MNGPATRARFCILNLLCAAAGAAPLSAQAIDTLALRAHTYFLSADALAGRGTGSPGEHMAAAYIESQLRALGLRGLMPGGAYAQPVPLRAVVVDPATRLTVSTGTDSGRASFEPGASFIPGSGGADSYRDFAGPAVLTDGASSDGVAAGSVVVVLGTLGADAATLVPAWERAGVAGLVQLIPDSAQFALVARSRGADRLVVDAPVDDPVWQPALPSVIGGPALAGALLRGTTLPQAAIEGAAFAPVPLGRDVALELRADLRRVDAANVGAVLAGSDPALRDEFVVFTAHYDHLGVAPETRDSIYNGFSDNAAGVAMVLAIARALRDRPPARSVAFLFLTAEERGLLGSSFFTARPPIPLERIAAVINLDAGAPPAPPVSWRIAGGMDSALGALAASIAAEHGWTARLSAASPNSDYWPFLRRGVPAIFLIPGNEWEDTSEATRDALSRRWDRYHRPDDEWAPDFPFAGLRRYATFALLVGRAAADAPSRR